MRKLNQIVPKGFSFSFFVKFKNPTQKDNQIYNLYNTQDCIFSLKSIPAQHWLVPLLLKINYLFCSAKSKTLSVNKDFARWACEKLFRVLGQQHEGFCQLTCTFLMYHLEYALVCSKVIRSSQPCCQRRHSLQSLQLSWSACVQMLRKEIT